MRTESQLEIRAKAQNLDGILGVLALIELGEAIAALVLDKRALTNKQIKN